MTRRIAVLVVVLMLFGIARVDSVSAVPGEKVAFCHRTDSPTNPYVLDRTDVDSIVKAGHGQHTGPIFPLTGPDGKWGDIIPPFTYTGGVFPGSNWTPLGQTVVTALCDVNIGEIPPGESTSSSTGGESTTTESSEQSTTSSELSGSETSVGLTTTSGFTAEGTTESSVSSESTTSSTSTESGAGGTTPSTVGPGPTTTVTLPGEPVDVTQLPPLTDPGPGVEIMPPLRAFVLVLHVLAAVPPRQRRAAVQRLVELGRLSLAQRMQIEAIIDQQSTGTMAFTGNGIAAPLVAAALASLLAGAAIMTGTRRRRLRARQGPDH